MQIRVTDLPAEGIRMEERLDATAMKALAGLQENGVCEIQTPLAATLRVTPSAGLIQVEGRIQGAAVLSCARCLARSDSKIDNSFRLTFAREVPGDGDAPSSDARELQAEELGLVLFEGESIDFRDIIQEQVVMAIPMQPLCRDDCRGLCTHCGADLNDGPCDCNGDDIDPRLAILKTLKIDS